MTALILTVLTAVVLTVSGTVFSQQIVDLSGARKLGEEMRRLSADYLFYYSAFSLPMLMSSCLSVFIRNDGSPALSFVGMCTGAVSNIFLDWLFSLSFIPMALNLVYTSLLYSTKRTTQSDIIAICRGIVIKATAIFCIPVIFGSKTIWAAPLVAEMITFVIAVILTKKTKLIYQ